MLRRATAEGNAWPEEEGPAGGALPCVTPVAAAATAACAASERAGRVEAARTLCDGGRFTVGFTFEVSNGPVTVGWAKEHGAEAVKTTLTVRGRTATEAADVASACDALSRRHDAARAIAVGYAAFDALRETLLPAAARRGGSAASAVFQRPRRCRTPAWRQGGPAI